MNILLRHTLRSLKKNRLQATVIALTVIIVSAILFVAFSVTDIFYGITSNEYARIGVDADIMVGNLGSAETFAKGTVDNVLSGDGNVEYVRYFLRTGTVVRTETDNLTVLLEATDLESYVKAENGFKLVASAERDGYPRALVSANFLKNNGLEIGSLIEILSPVAGQYITFRITHSFEDTGFFSSTTLKNVLVDISEVGSYGLVNNALIKLKDATNAESYIEKLSAALPATEVGSAFPVEYIESIVGQNSALLSIGVVFVAVILILILFTGYLIIARNRTDEMSVMKAAGATPAQTAAIMLTEAAIYGIIGAVIGVILGRAIMEALLGAFLPFASNLITYSFGKYALSFILGALTSIIAAIVPIAGVAGKSVRQLTETSERHARRAPLWAVILSGVILSALAVAIPLTPQSVSVWLVVAAIPATIAFIITVTPYVLSLLSSAFNKAVPSGAAKVAAEAAKRNGSLPLLSALISIAIVFSFLFTGVMDTVAKGITPNSTRFDADAVVSAGSQTFAAISENADALSRIDGAQSAAGVGSYGAKAYFGGEYRDGELTVYGVKNSAALNLALKISDGFDADLFDVMAHPVVLNYDFANRNGLRVGDKIRFFREIKTTTDELKIFLDAEFTVCGFEYSETEYNSVVYIKGSDFTENGEPYGRLGSATFIKFDEGADYQTVFSAVRDKAETFGNNFVTLTFRDYAYSAGQNVDGVIAFIRIIEVFFIIMAAVGIINVAAVSVFDRERELYLYKVYGMTFSDYLAFSATEGAIVGITGAITAFFAGLVAALSMPTLFAVIDKFYYVSPLPYELPLSVLGGAALFTLLSVIIALFNKNRFVNKRYGTERR